MTSRTALSDRTIPLLFLTDGLLCALLAVSAHWLGLDSNLEWSRPRLILFLIGLLLIAAFIWMIRSRPKFIESESVRIMFLVGHTWAVIFVIYAWFITFGNFTTWKNSTHYYTQLADAFSQGHLYVDAEPSAELLALDNPYDPDIARGPVDEVWDLSFYKGRFYLYWGPVPALLLLPVQFIFHRTFADLYLVYFFFCGLLVINSLIVLKLWKLFFKDIPARYVLLSIFAIGLILPVLWSLNIPDVYEAAIGAGQFFLMGGIYFAILAFEKGVQKRFLFLAGLCWACSVGSRAMNVLPLVVMVPLIIYWTIKITSKPIDWKQTLQSWMALSTPLLIGAIVIGWYNWARFDSPLEFGLRYQITIHDLNKLMPLTFLPDYILPNLYAYGFQPFKFISTFPFIEPITIKKTFEAFGITSPKIYFSGRLTGLFIYAPFLILAFMPLHHMLQPKREASTQNTYSKFIILLLFTAFAVNFLVLLFFFFGTLRYSVDVISPITLLAIFGYFQLAQTKVNDNARWLKFVFSVMNILIIFTIITSILLSFSSETNRMEKLNPELLERINSIFFWE